MAKTIQIDGTYSIEIDECNWILKKIVITADTLKSGKPAKNAGKPHTITLGYFSSLSNALKMYADSLERDGVLEAAEPVSVAGLESILLRIEKLCKGLKLAEKT